MKPERPPSTRTTRYGHAGEDHPLAKLTELDVRQIRSSAMAISDIAAAFDISRSHVVNIRAGRRWTHVP